MAPVTIVDPDGSSRSGERAEAPADSTRRTPLQQLATPLDPNGEPRELDGRPYLLFADWVYGEDWSGQYVREVHPFAVLGGRTITEAEFRALVSAQSSSA